MPDQPSVQADRHGVQFPRTQGQLVPLLIAFEWTELFDDLPGRLLHVLLRAD